MHICNSNCSCLYLFRTEAQANIITVSYFSHKVSDLAAITANNLAANNAQYSQFGAPQSSGMGYSGPPAAPQNSNYYRTLGTLDSQFHNITSKFAEDVYFHDIILR